MELEPISDWPTGLGFPHRAGRRRTELVFLPRLVEVLEICNDPWTGGGTLSFRGGACEHTNPNQPEIGRWGWHFYTMRGGINPDDIRVRPRVVGDVHVWMNSDPGM